jgi:hypothetical protein
MTQKVTGRLENWIYDPLWNVVWGNVYDDARKRFRDGEWIHTSDIPVTRVGRTGDVLKEGDIIKTLNSKYLLGKPQEKKDSKE